MNATILITPHRLFHMTALFGYLWVPFLFSIGRLKDPFFRAAAGLFPLVFGLMFIVGNIDEFRIYTELVPILLLSVALFVLPPEHNASAVPDL